MLYQPVVRNGLEDATRISLTADGGVSRSRDGAARRLAGGTTHASGVEGASSALSRGPSGPLSILPMRRMGRMKDAKFDIGWTLPHPSPPSQMGEYGGAGRGPLAQRAERRQPHGVGAATSALRAAPPALRATSPCDARGG